MTKTNAIRILEANDIVVLTSTYEFDENNLDAIDAAKKIGVEPERVFKTLVTSGDRTGTTVFCIPSNFELDLKKAAKASGNKKVEMVKVKDLFDLTGYVRGGCSPVGMKKKYPAFIDETSTLFDTIYVSAGQRGLQLNIRPEDLKKIVDAVFCDLI